MDKEDIRWKQRFQNYQKSLNYLDEALAIIKPDLIQKAGLIQFFEMTFELAWNTMKDYLEEEGFLNLNSPRETIKKAFEIELITDGHTWLKALEDRNLTSHTYDEETASEVENLIRNNYYHLLVEFFKTMKQKL
jgi:nucleotidyltransferase substrate binding protein (TIGR01987 family)